jgi:indolepyruvate ferredoxin oxidoreductase beta subunit
MSDTGRQQERTGWRILIAGTGGQGVLTAARLLCDCFVEHGHHVVSGQLHGMAQRGGAVQSAVIIDAGISPVIPSGRADFVLGFEPVETVRALPLMSADTIVYMNITPVVPFVLAQRSLSKDGDGEYPDVQELIASVRAVAPSTFTCDATQYASQAGSARALNMVMLGCLFGSDSLPCTAETFWGTVARRMPPHLQSVNAGAFRKGLEFARGLRIAGGTR